MRGKIMMSSRTFPDNPLVGVGVLVWRGDHVLLIRRGRPPGEGEWSLPGGAQELGETLFETAVREVKEETGLAIMPVSVLTAVDNIVRDPDGGIRYHYTIIDIMAEWLSGEPQPRDDIVAVQWATTEDAIAAVAWPATKRVLRMAGVALGKVEPDIAI